MADYLRATPLFCGNAVSIHDVTCRPNCHRCGDVECSHTASIVFVRRGAFVRHRGRREEFADATRVVFLNTDDPFRVSHPISGGDDCTSVRFAPDVLAEALASYSLLDRQTRLIRPSRSNAPLSLRTQAEFRRLWQAARTDTEALAIEEAALALLDHLLGEASSDAAGDDDESRESTRHAHQQIVSRAQEAIAARLDQRLSLDDLASAAYASRFHLARVFRRQTSLSIHEHQTRLRLARVLDRLAGGADDLARLALDVGFSSHSHLTREFTRRVGCTPSEFRRRLSTPLLRQTSTIVQAAHRVRG
jgi:AraC-like DNA-binding protein